MFFVHKERREFQSGEVSLGNWDISDGVGGGGVGEWPSGLVCVRGEVGEDSGEERVSGQLSLLGSGWASGWWFESVNELSPCCSAHSQGWRGGEPERGECLGSLPPNTHTYTSG